MIWFSTLALIWISVLAMSWFSTFSNYFIASVSQPSIVARRAFFFTVYITIGIHSWRTIRTRANGLWDALFTNESVITRRTLFTTTARTSHDGLAICTGARHGHGFAYPASHGTAMTGIRAIRPIVAPSRRLVAIHISCVPSLCSFIAKTIRLSLVCTNLTKKLLL